MHHHSTVLGRENAETSSLFKILSFIKIDGLVTDLVQLDIMRPNHSLV